MPLLRKKTLEKAPLPEFLRDDEEVFHCEMTNEIFRDYDEFAERTILCNSMVWKCSMTGKSNLTYVEALQSEENAKKSLKDLSPELVRAILFVATHTTRSGFGEMAEDVFLYINGRYFVGEKVEPTFSGSKWKEYQVFQVIASSEDNIKKALNGTHEKQLNPPPSFYKYSLESLDADDDDISEKIVVEYNQIRRKKLAYSKEKNKLLLKQHVEQRSGLWVIKQSSIDKYNINELQFDTIFDGPLPQFEKSKRIEKLISKPGAVNGKKVKQETLAKYLTKNNILESGPKKSTLLEKMKKKEEEFKLMKEEMKQKNAEKKMAEKQKKKEENIQVSIMLRDWNKTKEDLELEDQKVLPLPTPVKSKIPDEYMGDVLMVLEFSHSFSKILYTKDFFPSGLTFDLMERALMEKEVAGPFTDLIQMFLSALFAVQEEEDSQYRTHVDSKKEIKEVESKEDVSLEKATHFATSASSWCKKYQGLPLSRLPLYSLTVSEVLRLHLLTSGACINDVGARWRYAQRGGYTSEDDPGLHFRLHQAHILKALAKHNIIQLQISDKLKILSCLINQLLTYADVRDLIEERMDSIRQAKNDLRILQTAERKRRQEFITAKLKLKKEENKNYEAELENLIREHDDKQYENDLKLKELVKLSNENNLALGSDRAFRKYLKLESIPGIFVNHEEDNAGPCLNEVVPQNPELINASRKEILQYLKKLNEEMNTSDKENNPKKDNCTVNGVKLMNDPTKCQELYMCTADPKTCLVHSVTVNKSRWAFYHDPQQVEDLLHALNKRGIRESDLYQNIENDHDGIMKLLQTVPSTMLNPELPEPEENQKRPPPKKAKNRYEDANMGFPPDTDPAEIFHSTLTDNILEMEEKIHAGTLGTLKVKNRDLWRDNLQHRKYKELDKTLVKIENKKLLKIEKSEGKTGSRPNTPDSTNDDKTLEYSDPGKFLGSTLDVEVDVNFETEDLKNNEKIQEAISSLSIALTQVARAVDPKYLKKPLGSADKLKKDDKRKEPYDILPNWEESLLACTSFSQIFLHYGTLDSCIMWSKSALLAKCRICRRQKDSENMLLCDICNNGHHLYCLKPKLKAVPVGDWFCPKCVKEKEAEIKKKNPEPPAKKRKIFRDEDVDEEDNENGDESNGDQGSEEESSDEPEKNGEVKQEICSHCEATGELIFCDKCPKCYHLECVQPPLRRPPRGKWTCSKCIEKDNKKKPSQDSEDEDFISETGKPAQRKYTQRRCATRARNKILYLEKWLRWNDYSDDSDSGEEITNHRRSNRRDVDVRDDLPLHNAALQELLSDVMKHKDAWPFIRPVQKTEVPDYYEVITKPMDFGTIKYKLNMGNYKCDADLMADAVLVFENCNTYNDSDATVYKCGVRLLKHFEKKCKELGLKLPEEMQEDVEAAPKNKKRRTK